MVICPSHLPIQGRPELKQARPCSQSSGEKEEGSLPTLKKPAVCWGHVCLTHWSAPGQSGVYFSLLWPPRGRQSRTGTVTLLHRVVQAPRPLPLCWSAILMCPSWLLSTFLSRGREGWEHIIFPQGNITYTPSSLAAAVSVSRSTSTYESMSLWIDPPITQYPKHHL